MHRTLWYYSNAISVLQKANPVQGCPLENEIPLPGCLSLDMQFIVLALLLYSAFREALELVML